MKRELQRIIRDERGERRIHNLLKQHPALLRIALGQEQNGGYVIAEFNVGDEFRADFVSLRPTSAWFHITFIELEPIGAKLFTKRREPTAALNHAFNQIDQWRTVIEKRRHILWAPLARAAASRDLLYSHTSDEEDVTCTAGLKMTDERMWFSFDYFIFIGRRDGLSDADLEAKNSYSRSRKVEVATYDRLMDAEEMYDPDQWKEKT